MENKRKNKFWEDDDGNQSSTRVISFLFAIFFFWFTYNYLSQPGNVIDVNFLSLEAELLIAIFAPKYIKEFLFLKMNKKGGEK